jgi:glutamate dehydrogenase
LFPVTFDVIEKVESKIEAKIQLYGALFQGFHIRFRDISRGGIRLIFSRNQQAYRKNLETVFQENYGLAYTQNAKNKDIPEFSSKGTILLHDNAQDIRKYAFQCYVAALLDLLVLNDQIIDHYKQPKILFLGPDENTTDLMEWVALYAKKRGYSYWKAFTIGKPLSLGGVPHDTYGMTTHSVHQFVLGCLEKLMKRFD